MGKHWTRLTEARLTRLPGHPKLEAWMAQAKAILLVAEDRVEDALAEQRRALSIQEGLLGETHIDVGASLVNVAMRLHELGRDGEAKPVIARALAVFTKLFGDDNARVAVALLDEAEILTELGMYEQARADLERALAIWRAHGASEMFIGLGLLDIGRLDLAQGQLKKSRAVLEQVLQLVGASDPPTRAEAEFALAQALWASPGERPRAGRLAKQARTTLTLTPGSKRRIARIDAWLGAHPI
jgi:tetratricopeptide (TPR) repeat protein